MCTNFHGSLVMMICAHWLFVPFAWISAGGLMVSYRGYALKEEIRGWLWIYLELAFCGPSRREGGVVDVDVV